MAAPVFHRQSSCSRCGASGDDFASPNVECFELLEELICDDCADGALEEYAEANGQFGVGA